MCYTIPLAAAIIITILWRRKKDPKIWWLNLMLYGGALFGIVDHLWHGELLLISESISMDLCLGCAISAAIFASWGVVLVLSRISPILTRYLAPHKANGKEEQATQT